MAKDFYYQIMGEVYGPMSGVELRDHALAGDLTQDSLVRVGRDGDWITASRLKNLFDDHGRPLPHAKAESAPLESTAFHEVEGEHRTRRPAAASDLVLRAISFAARSHLGQVRKDRTTPYIAHPCRVMAVMSNIFGVSEPEALATAVLHDVIEDADVDRDDLAREFGERVARDVALLSKDKRLPEAERERLYLEQLAKASVEAKLCKLADVYDNLTTADELSAAQRTRAIKRARAVLDHLGQQMPDPWRHAVTSVVERLAQTMEKAG